MLLGRESFLSGEGRSCMAANGIRSLDLGSLGVPHFADHFPVSCYLFDNDMTEAPRIPIHFLGGTVFFGTGTFITAGTYTLLSGHKQALRYSLLTSLNVGVAGGLFTGTSVFVCV